jgi:hypothetical protein
VFFTAEGSADFLTHSPSRYLSKRSRRLRALPRATRSRLPYGLGGGSWWRGQPVSSACATGL